MLKKLFASTVVLAFALSASSADAALNAYMKIKTSKGYMNGGVQTRGHENTMAVIATSHEIISPRDAASGMPTGKRQHKPITITKELDKASPLLYNALTRNEVLPEVELQFYRATPGSTGMEAQFYTVKLTNATIASIRFVQPNTQLPETRQLPEYEEIAFTYQKIEWTINPGNVTAVDDWMAPR
jgi:type VI secretion system secreted protein Hcp